MKLVTVSIPTYNSEGFINRCIASVQAQTYKNIEINIVDGGSSDGTLEILQQLGVENIINCSEALLRARYEGVAQSKGDFILLLDSDQILEPKAIESAVKKIESNKLDMLVFEESVYMASSWIEKLFQQDRKLIHSVKDFSPYSGVMLPRFYRKDVLISAFKKIPHEVMDNVGGQDHAIIYYEAWQRSKKIDLLENAVMHIEPKSLTVMVRKFYRWGKTSRAAHHPRYEEMLRKKERFRKGLFGNGLVFASVASIILLLIKGLPFFVGLYSSKIHKKVKAEL